MYYNFHRLRSHFSEILKHGHIFWIFQWCDIDIQYILMTRKSTFIAQQKYD